MVKNKAKEPANKKTATIHFKNGQEQCVESFSHVRFVKDSRLTEFIDIKGKVKLGVPEQAMEFYEVDDVDEDGNIIE